MADTRTLVAGLEHKILKLIEENNRLSKTSASQAETIRKMNERLEVLEKTNVELSEQLNKKIIADAFNSEHEIEEGRKRVQALMREIEHCISLVNK
ncbi:MAG: hypothetical protein H3C41_11385 [Bacteroidales bacterium]|nr:hypothetical protein [Bacteroidales bacterium]